VSHSGVIADTAAIYGVRYKVAEEVEYETSGSNLASSSA
jgi:hypothetical protein